MEIFFLLLWLTVHTLLTVTEKAFFKKRSPEWRFLKARAYRFPWTDKNGGFLIRWCHTSYSACPVRDGIVFGPFHCFSVFVWTLEADSDTIPVDAYYFENGEKTPCQKIWGYLWTRPNFKSFDTLLENTHMFIATSKACAVMRALAAQYCGLGANPRGGAMCQ